MAILGGTNTFRRLMCQLFLPQTVEGPDHISLFKQHHRVTVRLLIAGIGQRIQGQGIVLGRRQIFLDQATHDSGFNVIKQAFHSKPLVLSVLKDAVNHSQITMKCQAAKLSPGTRHLR